MSDDRIEPLRPLDAAHAHLHHGPAGHAYEHVGPEARWGEGGVPPARRPARLGGRARGPTPFVPAHHERWGAFFWLLPAGAPPLRVLLGPMPAAGEPWLPPDGDAVEVLGHLAHLHGEDVLVASAVVHAGRRHLVR